MPELYIREIRKERGLKMRDAAAAAGLSHAQLCRIETGSSPTTTDRLPDIAKALGVSVAELFLSGTERAVIAAMRRGRDA